MGLLRTLELAKQYIERVRRDVQENRETWSYFEKKWIEYLKLRGIESGVSKPTFPEVYGVVERDRFYKSCSFAGTGSEVQVVMTPQ